MPLHSEQNYDYYSKCPLLDYIVAFSVSLPDDCELYGLVSRGIRMLRLRFQDGEGTAIDQKVWLQPNTVSSIAIELPTDLPYLS